MLCTVLVMPLEYLSRGSLCSSHLVTFWGCKLATSITWLNCGSLLLVSLVVLLVPVSVCLVCPVCSFWGVVAVVVGCAKSAPCWRAGGGLG